jgi:hypothetical protein
MATEVDRQEYQPECLIYVSLLPVPNRCFQRVKLIAQRICAKTTWRSGTYQQDVFNATNTLYQLSNERRPINSILDAYKLTPRHLICSQRHIKPLSPFHIVDIHASTSIATEEIHRPIAAVTFVVTPKLL